jgi:uncharacterized integral membrane protein (TIGR00697 family)
MQAAKTQRTYRYFDFVMAAFVAVLLSGNLIGAGKAVTIAGLTFGCGNIFFPLSYLFGDILTEVYGYAQSRRVVWAGFAASVFAAVMTRLVVALPPSADWPHQAALETMFGSSWRIFAASIFAYFFGEFTNSFVLAKLKVKTEGKFLWLRTIGSTIFGEAVDSLIFYPIAFWGIWEPKLLVSAAFGSYVIKVSWEILATPLTYKVVGWLKHAEDEDFYDRETKFTPFSLEA